MSATAKAEWLAAFNKLSTRNRYFFSVSNKKNVDLNEQREKFTAHCNHYE